MNVRYLVICSALLLLLCANDAYARDRYQRTEDRKTLFWNNYPKAGGNVAAWSGDRDKDRYATGHGTLTWYRTERSLLTGFHLPTTKHIVVSRYSGKMVHGKFEGMVVSVDAHGKTFHATFVDGGRTGKWAIGPAPSPSSPRDESVRSADRTGIAPDQRRDEQVQRAVAAEAEPEPPAAGPTSEPEEKKPVAAAAVKETPRPADQHASKPAVTETSNQGMDDSLKSLVGPPSLLRTKAVAAASPKASVPPKVSSSPQASPPPTTSSSPPAPRLTSKEVIALANAEARTQGYDLAEYQHPEADYSAAGDTWSVLYGQKNADGSGKQFSVSVEDKTKKASVVVER